METTTLIRAEDFCESHHIEIGFIKSLHDVGLIEITTIQEGTFIPATQLPMAERYTRMHYDLNINIEGIETIMYLLQRVDTMRQEINGLRNKLRLYEDND